MQKAVEEDNCCFGTVDTWLLHKLTKGKGGLVGLSQGTEISLIEMIHLKKGEVTFLSFPDPRQSALWCASNYVLW